MRFELWNCSETCDAKFTGYRECAERETGRGGSRIYLSPGIVEGLDTSGQEQVEKLSLWTDRVPLADAWVLHARCLRAGKGGLGRETGRGREWAGLWVDRVPRAEQGVGVRGLSRTQLCTVLYCGTRS